MSDHMKCPSFMSTSFTVVVLALMAGVGHAQTSVVENEAEAQVVQNKPATREIGDVTSSLLRTQSDGSMAGASLPMLGATTSISWERYKDSFTYRIPEYFGKTVKKSENQ